MSMAWIAIGTAVVGAGASLYGANKQASAIKDANAANTATQDSQNNAAWTNWLMTRGVAPTSPTSAGQLPSAYTAVNTRLPLWASVNMASGPSRWRKAGSNYAAPNTLAITAPIGNSGSSDASTTPAGATNPSTAPSSGQKIANLLDPLNVTVGKNKSFLDPLGIFG